jgi:hypothetical protein
MLYGGSSITGSALNEVWTTDGTQWTNLGQAPFNSRTGLSMAYDEERGEMVFFGGEDLLTLEFFGNT